MQSIEYGCVAMISNDVLSETHFLELCCVGWLKNDTSRNFRPVLKIYALNFWLLTSWVFAKNMVKLLVRNVKTCASENLRICIGNKLNISQIWLQEPFYLHCALQARRCGRITPALFKLTTTNWMEAEISSPMEITTNNFVLYAYMI